MVDHRTEAQRLRDAGLAYAEIADGLNLTNRELRQLRRRDRVLTAWRYFLQALLLVLYPFSRLPRRRNRGRVPLPLNSLAEPCRDCDAEPGKQHRAGCAIATSPIVLDTGRPPINPGPLACPHCDAGAGSQHSDSCPAI